MHMKSYLFFILFLAASALTCLAADKAVRQNWFNDPFFQISKAVADCPTPVGPFATEKERLANAHHRAERGTTCWLVGKCDRPNSYNYDQDIAEAFKAKLQESNPFADSTTLWVTVQGRVVYIEGCTAEQGVVRELEKYAMTLPYVEIAVAHVRTDPAGPPPYGVMNDTATPLP
ncbi:MAG TPA: transporter [Desulfobulbaceae bacterium]|nr:transporter [Desulfobulbaceae bacterium]